MQTIIAKACKELGIKPIPSKRVSMVVLIRFLLFLFLFFKEIFIYINEIDVFELQTSGAQMLLMVLSGV